MNFIFCKDELDEEFNSKQLENEESVVPVHDWSKGSSY
jgi:hypothetical protein